MSAACVTALAAESAESRRNAALLLVGARVTLGPHVAIRADVELQGPRIRSLATERSKTGRSEARHAAASSRAVDLSDCLILPGLINAHDHLEFNLFSRLGRGPYENSEAWARDIYHPDRAPVREQLAVPKHVRLWWGALKNLLCGVTTVCHHNPYEQEVFEGDFPIRVAKRYGWAHSPAFGKNLLRAFRSTPPDAPFIVHLAEGSDERSRNEIFLLDRLGALDQRTVIVHGVGLDGAGHALLARRGASLVWCPTSNLFTLGRTLDRQTVNATTRIALGSDSALTAQGDLLDEASVACRRIGLSAERIYEMLTENAARILRLHDGEGTLRAGAPADLIAIRDQGFTPAESLVGSDFRHVELVLLSGRLQLVSPRLAARWPREYLASLEPLEIEGTWRLVRAPVRRLLDEARERLGDAICLAGKRVSA